MRGVAKACGRITIVLMSTLMENLIATAHTLPRAEKATLASHLLAELADGIAGASDEEMDAIADEREREMDADPAGALSHDQMLAFIESRRQR
jgi:Putative addiction module component